MGVKIHQAVAIEGYGGYFYTDRRAIEAGAERDGFTYKGKTVTKGFTRVYQPGRAISVVLELSDGQIAHGEGTSVTYSGLCNRDGLFAPAEHIPLVTREVLPRLVNRELGSFRELAAELDTLEIGGHRLHSAVRYALSLAVLDAVAKARKETATEVIAREYRLPIVAEPVRLVLQCGEDRVNGIDKIILFGVPVIHPGSMLDMTRFNQQLDYIAHIVSRIRALGGEGYRPTLHIDQYGHVGHAFGLDVPRMVAYAGTLVEAAKPYPLVIEDPVHMSNRSAQIDRMAEFRAALRRAGVPIEIVADEWAPALEDIKAFVEQGAADWHQVKCPDLGSVSNAIEAILFCAERGVKTFLGGSCAEADTCARATVHVALATRPTALMAKPGLGVTEAMGVTFNEMARTLAILGMRARRAGRAAGA